MKIRLAGVQWHTAIAAQWISTEIFVQGCTRACPDCFNPETWDPQGGYEMDCDEVVQRLIEDVPYRRLTISGGEPMLQVLPLQYIVERLRAHEKPDPWTIICYTGYEWEKLILHRRAREFTQSLDIVVDGAFQKELIQPIRDFQFIGSSNQRMIDPRKSIERGKVKLWTPNLRQKRKIKAYRGYVDECGRYHGGEPNG